MKGYVCLKTNAPVNAEAKYDDDKNLVGRWCSGRPACLHPTDGQYGYKNARPAWESSSVDGRGATPSNGVATVGVAHRNGASPPTTGGGARGLVRTPDPPEIHSAGPSHLTPAESIPLFATAREIAEETPAETPWIARPWVARGSITELDGKLKASGKTTWLLAMVAAIVDGKPFMGQPTIKMPVIYLTEQAGPSLRDALKRAGLLDREDVHVMRWAAVRNMEWPTVVELAAAKADEVGSSVIAVDTLGQFTGLVGDQENNSGTAMQAMKPLQAVAATNIAVIISRHERKGGGQVGESARGSSAYSGVVDIVLSLRRPEAQSGPSVRVIQALSRFDETPGELVIDLVDGEYRVLGSDEDVKARQVRSLVLEVLPGTPDEAMKIDDVLSLEDVKEAKVKRTLLIQVLKEQCRDGTIQQVGKGVKNDAHRYFRPPEMHSSDATDAPAESISDDAGPLCANCGVMPVELPGLDCDRCMDGGE